MDERILRGDLNCRSGSVLLKHSGTNQIIMILTRTFIYQQFSLALFVIRYFFTIYHNDLLISTTKEYNIRQDSKLFTCRFTKTSMYIVSHSTNISNFSFTPSEFPILPSSLSPFTKQSHSANNEGLNSCL